MTGKTIPTHPSASTSAASTAAYTSTSDGDTIMANNSKTVDKIPYGEEVELCSLLVIDQHTFEGK